MLAVDDESGERTAKRFLHAPKRENIGEITKFALWRLQNPKNVAFGFLIYFSRRAYNTGTIMLNLVYMSVYMQNLN